MVRPIVPLHNIINKVVYCATIAIFVVGGAVYAEINTGNDRIHGVIVSKKKMMKDGTSRERVVIYPQEHHNSSRTIARNGLLVRHPDAKATILVCHGFMCDMHDAG